MAAKLLEAAVYGFAAVDMLRTTFGQLPPAHEAVVAHVRKRRREITTGTFTLCEVKLVAP